VKETGLSFAQCRQQARSLRALELAADGVAVTTIALELRYDNVSAFIDMFRRALRTAPGRYLATEGKENRSAD
jgi:AraC-like DNA-binding protein